jgi:tripartite-type tricarboxylate transporter receptor subunit TctC
VQFVFTVISTAQPLHRDGRVRIVAVAGPRQAVLPDVPSMAESGYPDLKLYFWFVAFMPVATPRAIVSRMNREINASVSETKTSTLLVEAGVTPEPMTLEELGALMRKDAERFRQIVIRAGIKPQPL